MYSAVRWSKNLALALVVLLLFIIIPQSLSGGDNDAVGAGGWGPGPGGGGGPYERNVEVYLKRGVKQLPAQGPQETASGLEITGPQGHVVFKKSTGNNGHIPGMTPHAKVTVLPKSKNSVTVQNYKTSAIFKGDYSAELRLSDLNNDKIALDLKGELATKHAIAVIRVGVQDDVSMENFETWMLKQNNGSMIILPNNGTLPVSELLEAAFIANSEIKQVGVLQVEFDGSGNIVKKTAMLAEKSGQDVKMQVDS